MYRPRSLDRDPDALTKRLRVMTRVRKLLRLAEDQADKPEGRNARQRAEELLAKNGMAWSVLEAPEWAGAMDFRHRRFTVGRDEAWRHTLVAAIAEYLDCVALHEKGAVEVETYGPEAALPQLEYAFSVYLRQLRASWADHVVDLEDAEIWAELKRAQQIDARNAFCVSFVLGVKERLQKDRQAELQDDPVAADDARRQRKELDKWMRRAGVRWRSMPSGVDSFSQEGFQAGQKASVEPAVGGRGGGPRRLTG